MISLLFFFLFHLNIKMMPVCLTCMRCIVYVSYLVFDSTYKPYKLLRKNKFSLPGIRTLRRWSKKIDVSRGILQPVVSVMSAANLTEAQKVCVLSFDEMKVKTAYSYDKALDSTLPPAAYVQVIMLIGLMSKWKQPIFYDFDNNMSKEILFEVIETCKKCGYIVRRRKFFY